MKMKIFLVLLLIMSSFNTLYLQEIPDCWCMPFWEDKWGGEMNKDSVVYDTCDVMYNLIADNCNELIGYREVGHLHADGRTYAKKRFGLRFDVDVIDFPEDCLSPNNDTVVYFNWTSIKEEFQNIKSKLKETSFQFADFVMIKYFYKDFAPKHNNKQDYVVIFSSYVNVKDVQTKLRNDSIPLFFYSEISFLIDGIEHLEDEILKIYPNPATDYIELNLDNVETGLRPVSEEIEIFDVLGNHPSLTLPASEEGTVRLDISHLQPGIYFIKIGDKFLKFVKI